jgi:hypothetical protein
MLTKGPHGGAGTSDHTRFSNLADTSVHPSPAQPADSGDFAVSLADAVVGALDYDQQQTLIREELDRRAWWEEILPQLLPPDFPVASGAGHSPTEIPSHGGTKAYHGPVEIFDD